MEKTKYQHPTIELCKTCEGTGIRYVFPLLDMLNQTEPEVQTCATCNGSGRVLVSKVIKTKIEPFKQQTN